METIEQQQTTQQAQTLRERLTLTIREFFSETGGEQPSNVYLKFLSLIEEPLLKTVLHHTRGNQSKAAIILGMSRGTLRKKLKKYDHSSSP